jgi:DNA-binding LacI/PurR family transcriptional regulator
MSVQSRVTLAAVARQARVSLATASKVLNGRVGVGTDTRHRVEAILADVGYIAQGAPDPPVTFRSPERP